MAFRIVFFKTATGKSPVEEFLDTLNAKQAQKVTWVLRLVQELDPGPQQYFKKLQGAHNLWELRVQMGSDIFRILGFTDGAVFVATNGFAKKTRKTPEREIHLALHRQREYAERNKQNGK